MHEIINAPGMGIASLFRAETLEGLSPLTRVFCGFETHSEESLIPLPSFQGGDIETDPALETLKTQEPFMQQSTVPDKQTSHSISSHSEISLTNFVSAKKFHKPRLRLQKIYINIASRSNSKRRKFRSRNHRTHISHLFPPPLFRVKELGRHRQIAVED